MDPGLIDEKRCPSCGETKPLEGFYRLARSKDGRQGYCKLCANAKRLAWKKANPEKDRRWNRNGLARMTPEQKYEKKLRSAFKMSLAEHAEILARQGGVCASCERPPAEGHRLHVDHDHSCCPGRFTCGRCVRGLLCLNCNAALGHAGDSEDRLEALIDYLRRTKC